MKASERRYRAAKARDMINSSPETTIGINLPDTTMEIKTAMGVMQPAAAPFSRASHCQRYARSTVE